MVAIELNVLPAETVRVGAANVRNFRDAGRIREGIARIPGVTSVNIEAPGGGMLAFVVQYQGVVPFAVHLHELMNRRFDRVFPDHVAIEEYELLDVTEATEDGATFVA